MGILRAAGKKLRDWPIPPLAWLEHQYSRADRLPAQTSLPFLVIVGPPRVGSTLMYQLLLSQFRFFYFDNFQHGLLRYPHLALRVSHALHRIERRQTNLQSDHGFVDGFWGASEGNYFWPYWFDMKMTQAPVRPIRRREGHALALFDHIHQSFGLPLTNSYNAHAFYMNEVRQLFGPTVFITLQRAPLPNAMSILRARKRLCQDVRQWWSIQPAGCVGLEHECEYTQIARQLRYTYAAIATQRQEHPHLAVIDVSYEALCRDPGQEIDRIADFCQSHDLELKRRMPPPPLGELPCRVAHERAEASRMKRALEAEGLQHVLIDDAK